MLSKELIKQPIKKRLEPLRFKKNKESILVHEIYSSIQGESSYMGMPCVFIRTTGCHLRCNYCDTQHAFFKGTEHSIKDIIHKISDYNINLVELTGGEPLLQTSSYELLKQLCDLGHTVLVETSGAISISKVDKRVKVILDIKTPDSGEHGRMNFDNLNLLWPGCEVKFVISSLNDYEYAKNICEKYNLYHKTKVLFSPVISKIDAKILAEKIIADNIPVRFQMQLHRILWGEQIGK